MKSCIKYLNNVFLKLFRSCFYLLLLVTLLCGCVSVRPTVELKYTDGSVAESLSSNASLSFVSSDQSFSGSGVLMFRKPDQIRAVILSPFGSVLQEIYVNGENITIVDTGNGTAFSGTFMDLPVKGNFGGWRNILWLIDIDPPESSRRTAAIERTNRYGHQEKAAFENGLLISKTTAAGDHVRYGRYTTVKGVAFPLEIIYKTVADEKFTIQLEEPEINVPFADGVFTAKLSKYRVYPLSVLR
jgi:outer membrane lipoprotein-sorting protein